MRLFVAVVVCILFATGAHAGIYSPNEPFLFEIDADGFAKPIQYGSGGYESVLAGIREIAILPQTPMDPIKRGRDEVLKRVKQREDKGTSTLTDAELAGLAVDFIRLNENGKAINVLQPRAARGGFTVYMHLARARAGQGEWQDAVERERIALADFPTSFTRITAPQLAWLKRVERDYYLPFLSHRADEARRGRTSSRQEELDVLFPTTPAPRMPENPLRFVGPGGAYLAGIIDEQERKKLPPDAIAIVQQLVLWHPFDGRLYWLLGELYNAEGEVETAFKILDECTNAMALSNDTVREHRRILKTAAEASVTARFQQAARLKAEADAERDRQIEAARVAQKRFWWILSIGVALGLLLIYYQSREVIRRIRRRKRA